MYMGWESNLATMTSRKDASDSVSLQKDEVEMADHLPYEYEEETKQKEPVVEWSKQLDSIDHPDEGDRDILRFSPEDIDDEYLDAVISDPDYNLKHLVIAARNIGYDDAYVVGELPSNHKRIEDLRARDIGSLVSIDAKVTDTTEQYSEVRKAVFICEFCGAKYEIRQDHLPGSLEHGGKTCGEADCDGAPEYRREHLDEEAVDAQQLILQDLHIKSSKPTPAEVTASAYNGLVDAAEPGSDVTVTAIVRSQPRDVKDPEKTKANELKLHVVGIEHHDEDYAGVEVDEEDRERIEELADDPRVYEKLADSIAPSIRGDYSLARQAVLYQLFGGVDHSTPDEKYRSDIHVAYVGDPGTGKSALGRYSAQIAPTSVYQSADNATKVGLTASVTHEDRFDSAQWTLSGGALVRADGGLCVIDELDKAPADVQGSLQEPLSEQQVSVSKSSISATLPARCSALLIANPEDERFDEWEPLGEQIDVAPAIWDRLDIIVPFADSPEDEKDAEVADAILDRATEGAEEYVPSDLLTRYVALGRQIDPVMTDDAKNTIRDAYLDLRGGSEGGRVPVGARQLNSFMRLAEASARIRLSEKVEVEDAERAIDIMREWMEVLMTDERGNLDADALGGSKTYTQRERIAFMWEQFEDLDDGDGVERDRLADVLEDAGIDRGAAQQSINKFVGSGEFIQEEGVLYDGR